MKINDFLQQIGAQQQMQEGNTGWVNAQLKRLSSKAAGDGHNVELNFNPVAVVTSFSNIKLITNLDPIVTVNSNSSVLQKNWEVFNASTTTLNAKLSDKVITGEHLVGASFDDKVRTVAGPVLGYNYGDEKGIVAGVHSRTDIKMEKPFFAKKDGNGGIKDGTGFKPFEEYRIDAVLLDNFNNKGTDWNLRVTGTKKLNDKGLKLTGYIGYGNAGFEIGAGARYTLGEHDVEKVAKNVIQDGFGEVVKQAPDPIREEVKKTTEDTLKNVPEKAKIVITPQAAVPSGYNVEALVAARNLLLNTENSGKKLLTATGRGKIGDIVLTQQDKDLLNKIATDVKDYSWFTPTEINENRAVKLLNALIENFAPEKEDKVSGQQADINLGKAIRNSDELETILKSDPQLKDQVDEWKKERSKLGKEAGKTVQEAGKRGKKMLID